MIIAAVAVLVIALAMVSSAYATYRYEESNVGEVLPGVEVAGVDVGSMTRNQATVAVEDVANAWLSQRLKVTAAGETWNVTPAELGVTAAVDPAVQKAFEAADSYSWMSRAYHRIAGKPVGVSIAVEYSFDKENASKFVKKASRSVLRESVNAEIKIGAKGALVFQHSRPGRQVDDAQSIRDIRNALGEHQDSVKLSFEKVRPEVTNKTLGGTIVVDLSENRLRLYDGFKVAKSYPVATAAPGYETPVGSWHVVNKVEDPTWINPAPNGWGAGAPASIPPGPGNPLGTRAIYLDAPGIRIHGTYDSGSIGTYASHGCIRMYISDSEELYPLVKVGMPALIVR